MPKNTRILITILLTSLLASACADLQVTSIPTAAAYVAPTPEAKDELFEAIWARLESSYVYYDVLGVNWESLYNTTRNQVLAASNDEAINQALLTMLSVLPDDSWAYQTREARIANDLAENNATYEGIGTFVAFRDTPEPHIVLLSVIPESPAESAGLKAHDSILAINGLPVTLEEGLNAVNRVRGPAGSIVTLTILSPGQIARDVQVTRGSINSNADRRYIVDIFGSDRILYIQPPRLGYNGMEVDLFSAIQAGLEQYPVEGIILDLRTAATGGGWPVGTVLRVFTSGELGEYYDRRSTQPFILDAIEDNSLAEIPLAVLIGPDTNGLPEILASSLQANGRATLVGLPTPGLIEGFETYAMPDGAVFSIATISYRAADGAEIGLNGVLPDVHVNADWDTVSAEAGDDVIEAAVSILLSGQR